MSPRLKRILGRLWQPVPARWALRLPRVNGLRTPPRHLPAATRDAMWRDVTAAVRRSRRCRAAVYLIAAGMVGCSVLLLVWSHRLHGPADAKRMLWWCGAMVAAGYAGVLAIARWVIRPAVAAIVAGVWWANDACPSCDFDVRVTPGRCPECGATAPAVR